MVNKIATQLELADKSQLLLVPPYLRMCDASYGTIDLVASTFNDLWMISNYGTENSQTFII